MSKVLLGAAVVCAIAIVLVAFHMYVQEQYEFALQQRMSVVERLNALGIKKEATAEDAEGISNGAGARRRIQLGENAIFSSPHDRPFPLPLQRAKTAYDKCMAATDTPELEKMIARKQVFRVPDRSEVSKVMDIGDTCSLIRVVSVPEGKLDGAVGHLVVAPNEFLVKQKN